MTATPALLVAAQALANASALLYTAPATGRGAWIDKATAENYSGAARTVTFNIVPAAGAAASANLVVNAKSIADKATDLLPELVGQFLPAGAMIYGHCDSATSVGVRISGRELT